MGNNPVSLTLHPVSSKVSLKAPSDIFSKSSPRSRHCNDLVFGHLQLWYYVKMKK